jgi:hypothetical protein
VVVPLGPGAYRLVATGTYSYAAWAPGVAADAAYSYEPALGACVRYRSDLHALFVDGAYPWANSSVAPDGLVVAPPQAPTPCAPATHAYALLLVCPAACALDLAIADDDYHDNAGALDVALAPLQDDPAGASSDPAAMRVGADGGVASASLPAGSYHLRASGVSSYAVAFAAIADAAYSTDAFNGACFHAPGNAHALFVDGQYPWNGTVRPGDAANATWFQPDGSLVVGLTTTCQAATHAYDAILVCPSACAVALRIVDTAYADNAGSLTVRITPTG